MERDSKITGHTQTEPILNKLPSSISKWAQDGIRWGFLLPSQLENRPLLDSIFFRLRVALHETGHRFAAKGLSGTVRKVSVIPIGDTLGSVSWLPNLNQPQEGIIRDIIVASTAGEAAENLFNISDHSGCGSDRGKARFFSRMLSSLKKSATASEIISSSYSQASDLIRNIGSQQFKWEAWKLSYNGIIT